MESLVIAVCRLKSDWLHLFLLQRIQGIKIILGMYMCISGVPACVCWWQCGGEVEKGGLGDLQ